MTDRELLERVRTHLLAQGRRALRPVAPSTESTPGCAFRTVTEEGETLRCAVGCLIPDGLYDPEMEGSSLDSYIVRRVLGAAGVLPIDALLRVGTTQRLLAVLMSVHDEARPERWEALLTALSLQEAHWSADGRYVGPGSAPEIFGMKTWEEAIVESR